MRGLGPNHIDLRWVQIIQMYSYSNQTTSKPGLMDFCAEDQKVCHSSCKIGTKISPIYHADQNPSVEESAQQS